MELKESNKIAIILGASGLVGNHLLQILLTSDHYTGVIAFVRKDLKIKHPLLTQHIIEFDDPSTYSKLVSGDDLFCCLGTTIKKAKSQTEFRKIDLDYPIVFARIAKEKGVQQCLTISSIGANINSSVFYVKTKGECEEELRKIGIRFTSILRPSFLVGKRDEQRIGEKAMIAAFKKISFLLIGKLKKYRPIQAQQVAKAMYTIAQRPKQGFNIYESDDLMKY